MALQVDRLLGSREIVVKTLGVQFSTVRGVSGATVMGDGSVVVILDLHALIREQLALELTRLDKYSCSIACSPKNTVRGCNPPRDSMYENIPSMSRGYCSQCDALYESVFRMILWFDMETPSISWVMMRRLSAQRRPHARPRKCSRM